MCALVLIKRENHVVSDVVACSRGVEIIPRLRPTKTAFAEFARVRFFFGAHQEKALA